MVTFDCSLLKAFIDENTDFLTGARIQKIQQPTRRELILVLRNEGISSKFYININPQFYHVCFMSDGNEKLRGIEIPQKPPMFCMQLRKYIENARIVRVNQPDNERILELFFETYNELGEKIELCLAVELMGKHSNIILYNADTNVILGCAHNVGADKSSVREIIGGLPYVYPPKREYICETTKLSGSVNDTIDKFFANKISENNLKSLRAELINFVQKQVTRLKNQCELIEKNLKADVNYEEFKHIGDLIMANLYNLKAFTEKITVFDYESNTEREIDVDKELSAKDNAQKFYKKYTKIKKRYEKNKEISENYEQKLKYFNETLYYIEKAQDREELKEIKSEIMPSEIPVKTQTKITEIEINGFKVFVGKNNRQNDYIVSKLARDEDYWFHVHNATGSHVLLKSAEPDEKTIFECAKLAKEFSSAKNSTKAGVIYTKAKYLKKPPKAPLGLVLYRGEREIIV